MADPVKYVLRFGGRCLECADHAGICPASGLPCDGREKAVQHVVEALAYGIRNGFIEPFEVGEQPGSPSPNPPTADYAPATREASNFTLHRQPRIVTGGFVGVPREGEEVCRVCDGTGVRPISDPSLEWKGNQIDEL